MTIMKTLSREPVIVPRASHSISRNQIDPDALKVLYRLSRNGFKAYMVGGAVRDLLLGKKPKDFDIATDARPGQVKKLFANCFLIGRRFRLAHIRFKGGKIIEVATFRREPEPHEEGESDPHNTFGTPMEDAFRRDISINALFYDIKTFSIIDYVGGLDDLDNRRVCIIGDPKERYLEDPVRMWRVLRYASRQGFSIEHETMNAICRNKDLLGSCSGSRLYEEMNKDLVSGFSKELFQRMSELSILSTIMGKVGRIIEQNSEVRQRFIWALGVLDEAVKRGEAPSQVVSYGLFLWSWAGWILHEMSQIHQDRLKHLTDELAESGITLTIPKTLKAGAVHALETLFRMDAALLTGRMRSSLLKKASYAEALVMFSLITQGSSTPGEDAFVAAYHQKFPHDKTVGRSPDKRKRRRKFRRRKPKDSQEQIPQGTSGT